jgi:MFS family permease
VGLASALVGLFQVLGNAAGFGIGALAVATNNFWLGTMALGALEFATMLSVVIRVNEGRAAKSRGGRSWRAVGLEAWGTDILRERSFVWLVGSRWFVLMGMTMLTNFSLFYFVDSFGLLQSETGVPMLAVLLAFVAGNLVAVLPAGRASDRIGRKPLIYLSCAVGSAGLAIVALAPVIPVAVFGGLVMGVGFGMFLAVDWALLTDLVPKASAGRYMGISNVATATAGLVGLAVGGLLIDLSNNFISAGIGPRVAFGMAVALLGIGAILLRPVKEPVRPARDAVGAVAA